MDEIIEDINEIDGIYSVEQAGNSGRPSLLSSLTSKLWPFRKRPKDPPSM
jgi:hypothetical protein